MKPINQNNFIMKNKILLLGAILTLGVLNVSAQPAPLPDCPTGSSTPIGGGTAPIDGGLTILLVLSAFYGVKRTYMHRKVISE